MNIIFRLAKVRHGSLEDALKLEPLIRSADVVSTEVAGISEHEARRIEDNWKDTLEEKRKGNLIYIQSRNDEYGKTMQRLLLRHSKPLVLLERFSEEESNEIRQLVDYGMNEGGTETFRLLLNGDLEGSVNILLQRADAIKKSKEKRDENMAKNARAIQDRIFELYPHLSKREELDYLVQIGLLHKPEEGLGDTPNSRVVIEQFNYVDTYTNWLQEIFIKAIQGKGFSEYETDVYRYLLSGLFKSVSSDDDELAAPVGDLVVKNMGYAELQDVCSRLSHGAETPERTIEVIVDFFAELGIKMPQTKKEFRTLYYRYKNN